jgi:chemotaxis methyl-accepting protein methylase
VENKFHSLLDYIQGKSSFRCQYYKEKPLTRRIRVRMRALHLDEYDQYLRYLIDNPEEMEVLLETLTINLSYFFRNPETFDYIRDTLFVEMRGTHQRLVVWSAGCAHGEEPYSLAISAAQSGVLDRMTIHATDIDHKALDVAQQGVYDTFAFQYTPRHILDTYFQKQDAKYRIMPVIKERVKFCYADLFDKPPFGACDLIVCRNVLIYLDRPAQSAILKNFYEQLQIDGYLIIGKVELLIGIPEVKLFEVVNRMEHVYKKKA